MTQVHNPILPGFHPDPCLIRVGKTYYLATSTFEWWPGVRLHSSEDLIHWKALGGILTKKEQLDLSGVPDSGGVWAPGLSHAQGRFWLVYTHVRNADGPYKDVTNYLVSAPSAEGPWSNPITLNTTGFDPSLFHDDDGRIWLLSQLWDPRPSRNAFAGITLQEFGPKEQRLLGEPRVIFKGTKLGCTEGPHLYKKDGYFYLVTAEGGTGWEHAVSVARSRLIEGPYEMHPDNPILSARDYPECKLQKAGHASLVPGPGGGWVMAHLCSRPVGRNKRCILGRETALQAVHWPEGDWPRLLGGLRKPSEWIELPSDSLAPSYLDTYDETFDRPALGPHWQTLRSPPDRSWLSLKDRPGFLRLRGRASLASRFDQSHVGFRLLHHQASGWTRLDFRPKSWQQSAGLVLYYATANFYYLQVSRDENGARTLQVVGSDSKVVQERLAEPVRLASEEPLELGFDLDFETAQFWYREGWGGRVRIGPSLDATILSDDYPIERGIGWGFTGAFVSLYAHDTTGRGAPADFTSFHYRSSVADT